MSENILNFKCSHCDVDMESRTSEKGHDIACETCGGQQKIPFQGVVELGNLLDDFIITDIIGEGAMGTVFKAKHILMKRDVALKVIKVSAKEDREEQANAFITEIQYTSQLDHPNIVTVYNAGYVDGILYVAMRYIEGFDMSDHVRDHGPMKEKECLAVISILADAMRYAWKDYEMVHRDIKPENIRMSSRGEIILMDFGLATVRTKRSSAESQGLIIGTPDFMSPEQARAQSDLDPRSDMYSLGIVLIYLLTGRRPFHSKNPMEVVDHHLYTPLPKLEDLYPAIEISEETRWLLSRLTRKNRDERFTDWPEAYDSIESIMTRDVIKAREAEKKTKTAIPVAPKAVKVIADEEDDDVVIILPSKASQKIGGKNFPNAPKLKTKDRSSGRELKKRMDRSKKKQKSGAKLGVFIFLVVALAAVGAGVYAYKNGLLNK